MAEHQNSGQAVEQEQEIDLIALVKRLWDKRKFIIYVTCAFIVLGLMVALFSKKEYTAGTIFVPQISQQGVSSSMSSLASLAGINLSSMGGDGALSPAVYPQLLQNVDLIKELMYTKVKFEEWPEPITLYDYYTNPEYNHMTFFDVMKKYTIGLPGVIIGAIKGKTEIDTAMLDASGLPVYTEDEYACKEILTEVVSVTINDKDGYIQLSVNMPEPLAAAEVASAVFGLLEKYVTEYKIEKAKSTLEYVDARYNEAKMDFESKQLEYANYRDANRNVMTATAMVTGERLKKEYDLANTVFMELARQKTQVELQVKENTPVLSVVQPVVVPFERSKPKRAIILIAFTFLGGCIACASVFGLDFLKNQGSSWPRRWDTVSNSKSEENEINKEE